MSSTGFPTMTSLSGGTEQEISSNFGHLEGDTKDVCFLVSILQVRARVVSFSVLLPQEHSACMGRLPRLYPAPRFDESINRLGLPSSSGRNH